MSDKLWTEMTGGRRPPSAPPPGGSEPPARVAAKPLALVKDAPPLDAFADPQAYEAVRSLHTRSNDAFFFIPGQFAPYMRPYAQFMGAMPLPDGSGLLVQWPGVSFEVRGKNLLSVVLRLSARQADVWRVFRPDYHAAPEEGAAVILSMRAILDDEEGR